MGLEAASVCQCVSENKNMTNPNPSPLDWSGRRKVLRWPAMIPRKDRCYWPGTRRGFTLLETLVAPPCGPVLEVVLRDYWLLIAVEDGELALRDPTGEFVIRECEGAGITSPCFELLPGCLGSAYARAKLFLFSRLPIEKYIGGSRRMHDVFRKGLPDTPGMPGIFPLGNSLWARAPELSRHPRINISIAILLTAWEPDSPLARFLASGPAREYILNGLPEPPAPAPRLDDEMASLPVSYVSDGDLRH
jgi:hypothetical protein